MPSKLRFKSKVDWWFYLVLGALPVMMLATLLPAVTAGHMSLLLVGFILLLSLGLPFWLFLSTNYQINDDQLLIKAGPFKWVVPVNEIESVSPSNSPLSSPALSMDRLELSYSKGKRLLISPADKTAFLAAIGHPKDNG